MNTYYIIFDALYTTYDVYIICKIEFTIYIYNAYEICMINAIFVYIDLCTYSCIILFYTISCYITLYYTILYYVIHYCMTL